MKKSAIIAALLLLFIGESFAQRNPYTRRLGENKSKRKEFILPQVNGYNIYKADLHTHTAFSDGSLMPKARVEESLGKRLFLRISMFNFPRSVRLAKSG